MNTAIRSIIAAGALIAASPLSLHSGVAAPGRQAPAGSTAKAEAADRVVAQPRQRVPEFGPFVAAIRASGVVPALESYRAARTARTAEAGIDEDTMNRIGYALLRDKRIKDAVEVFTQNVADHPGSWNAHDSLGEAYAADGNATLAIRSYERSLELNPANTGGAEALKKLRAAAVRD